MSAEDFPKLYIVKDNRRGNVKYRWKVMFNDLEVCATYAEELANHIANCINAYIIYVWDDEKDGMMKQ